MNVEALKDDLAKKGVVVTRDAKTDPYKVYVPDSAKLKVTQVSGSVAGAGSGEFHVYRASRRREQDRMARVVANAAKAEKLAAVIQMKEEAREEQLARTAKLSAKRKRRKEAKRKWKKKKRAMAASAALAYPNDGSFMDRFLRKQQTAESPAPSGWADWAANAERGPISAGPATPNVPLISVDKADVVVKAARECADGDRLERVYARAGTGGAILGTKVVDAEGGGGGGGGGADPVIVRFTGVAPNTSFVAFSYYSKSGLRRSEPFQVADCPAEPAVEVGPVSETTPDTTKNA